MSDKETLNKIRNNVINNMYLGTPNEYRAFNFLLSELDRQHDEFYNEVRIAHQDNEMSSHRHALYAGELREKIESLKAIVESQDTAHDKFVNDAYDAVKKLEKEVADQKAITELAVKENAELRAEIDFIKKDRDTLERESSQAGGVLIKKLKAATKALEWYADKENYKILNQQAYDEGCFAEYEIFNDEGEFARQFLSHIKGGETDG